MFSQSKQSCEKLKNKMRRGISFFSSTHHLREMLFHIQKDHPDIWKKAGYESSTDPYWDVYRLESIYALNALMKFHVETHVDNLNLASHESQGSRVRNRVSDTVAYDQDN